MKKLICESLLLMAAMLALNMNTVYAQDNVTANIPFAFRLNDSNLSGGQYNVGWLLGDKTVILFRNVKSGETNIAQIRNRVETKGDRPFLTFRCGQSRCTLAEVSFGQGRGWEFEQPKADKEGREHLATIYPERVIKGK